MNAKMETAMRMLVLAACAGGSVCVGAVPVPRAWCNKALPSGTPSHPAMVVMIQLWPSMSTSTFIQQMEGHADYAYDQIKSRGLSAGKIALKVQHFGTQRPASTDLNLPYLGAVQYHADDQLSSSEVSTEYWINPWFKSGRAVGTGAFEAFVDRFETRRNTDIANGVTPAARPDRIIFDEELTDMPTSSASVQNAWWLAMMGTPSSHAGKRGYDSAWPVRLHPDASNSANTTLAASWSANGSPSMHVNGAGWSEDWTHWYQSLYQQARSTLLANAVETRIGAGKVWADTKWSNYNSSTTDGGTSETTPPFQSWYNNAADSSNYKRRIRSSFSPFVGAACWYYYAHTSWAPLNAPVLYTNNPYLWVKPPDLNSNPVFANHTAVESQRWAATMAVCRQDVESIIHSSVSGAATSYDSITPWILPVGYTSLSYTVTKDDARQMLVMLSGKGIAEFNVFSDGNSSGVSTISAANWTKFQDALDQAYSSNVTGTSVPVGTGTVTADQLRRTNWDFANATTTSGGAATIEATLETTHASHNNLRVVVEMKPPTGSGASAQLLAYNYATSDWDVIGTVSSSQWKSPRTIVTAYDQFARASDQHVNSSNGEMKVRVAVTGATGSSTVSVDAVQVYRMDELCVKDYNRNGAVASDDLTSFQDDYYGSVVRSSDDDRGFGIRMPGTSTPFGYRADFTQDGLLTLDDLGDFITEYYSSPGTGCS